MYKTTKDFDKWNEKKKETEYNAKNILPKKTDVSSIMLAP